MTCKACEERGKTWNGSNPTCAFEKNVFSPDNFMCATANLMREVAQLEGFTDINHVWTDDENYSTINVNEIKGVDNAMTLWVSWYKSRGRTQAMWLLSDKGAPRQPTEAECLLIAKHYGIAKPKTHSEVPASVILAATSKIAKNSISGMLVSKSQTF